MNVVSPTPRAVEGTSSAQGDGYTIFDRLWRRRGLFAIWFAIPVAIALAVLLLARPTYVASGSVMVGEQEASSSGASPAWVQKLGDPADMESQLLILKSSRMLRLVLSRAGVLEAVRRECRLARTLPLRTKPDCESWTFDHPDVLQHIERRYSAQAVGRSRVISIGYDSPLPDVAFIMANALLVSYLDDQRAQNAQSRSRAAGWILKEGERAKSIGGAPDSQFYADLHRQVSDLETERRNLLNGGRLVSLAEVPRLPYFPKTAPVLAAGVTLGVILGSLAALFRDMTDHRVRRAADLVAATGVPVLGRLSVPRRWRSLVPALRGASRDDIRALYAQVVLCGADEQKVVMVTSSVPGEGKSFTALALAEFASKAGRRVLVVDCNLRRPTVASALQVNGGPGLIDVISGASAIGEAIQKTSIPGLDILAAGAASADPTVLLLDGQPLRRLDQIEGYNLILLDGPSMDHIFDGLAFARFADRIVWCVRLGHAAHSDVLAALDKLGNMRGKLAGFAVTRTEVVGRRVERGAGATFTAKAGAR